MRPGPVVRFSKEGTFDLKSDEMGDGFGSAAPGDATRRVDLGLPHFSMLGAEQRSAAQNPAAGVTKFEGFDCGDFTASGYGLAEGWSMEEISGLMN